MSTTTLTPVNTVANWTEQKNRLQSKFSILTDSDLAFEEGKQGEMPAKVQVKLG